MSSLYILLEQARATRVRLEAEQAVQTSLYGGYAQMLSTRLERRIAAYEETGDELGLADFLKHFNAAREAL